MAADEQMFVLLPVTTGTKRPLMAVWGGSIGSAVRCEGSAAPIFDRVKNTAGTGGTPSVKMPGTSSLRVPFRHEVFILHKFP